MIRTQPRTSRTPRTVRLTTASLAAGLLVSACGAPPLSEMHPTVPKQTVWMGLARTMPGWSAAALEQTALQAGTVPFVTTAPAGTGQQAFAAALQADKARTYIWVNPDGWDGTLPAGPAARSASVCVVTPVAVPLVSGVQVITGPTDLDGYLLGSVAGLLAASLQQSSIAVSIDHAGASQGEIQSALAGAVQVVPNLSVQAMNWTSPGSTPPASSTRVVLALGPLTAAQWQQVTSAGDLVVSLTPPSGNHANDIAFPVLPPLNDMAPLLTKFLKNPVPSGHIGETAAASVYVNRAALTAPAMAKFDQLSQQVQVNPTQVQQAWDTLPTPEQNALHTWVTLGFAGGP
ncbi:MAG: hypothetical protein K6T78_07305 [Alicyclobacillus sp.]|nr:hypothetical protein [Alicyclobacillus sp.]